MWAPNGLCCVQGQGVGAGQLYFDGDVAVTHSCSPRLPCWRDLFFREGVWKGCVGLGGGGDGAYFFIACLRYFTIEHPSLSRQGGGGVVGGGG